MAKSSLSYAKKVTLVVTIASLVVAAAVFGYQALNKSTPSKALKAPPVVTVTTVAAKLQPVDDTLSVTGSVSAWDPLSVGAEVSGLRIKEVNVEEGDLVKKGQPLAVLNSALLRAQLEQARARLLSSQANLKKSIQPNRLEDIHGLQAALAQAQANTLQERAHRSQTNVNLANAQINARRYAELARMGASSSQEAETKQLAADTARQDLISSDAKIKADRFLEDQASEKLLAATRGGRVEDVDISKATIAETTGQIHDLTEQIDQTIIRAPDDGLISKRDAHIGDITASGTPLFQIIRLNRLELRAQVSDIDLSRFKQGQIVAVSVNENDGGHIQGRVKLISPQVDPVTRLGTVRIELPANAGLKPGMFVRGQVKLGHRQSVTVPVGALLTRNGESFVFTLDGDRAVTRPVKVGTETDTFAEITDGLAAKETVIERGARFLSDRDVVRVSQ